MRRHAPHLSVLAFAQSDFQPARGNRRPIPDGWISRPKILRLGNALYLTWPGMEVAKINARRKLLQGCIGGDSFDLNPVPLGQLVPRIGNPRLQDAIVGQYHQPFRVGIQAPGGIYLGDRDEVGKGAAASRIAELREHTVGLVEKDQTAQTLAWLPNMLQKRSDSG